MITIVNNKGTSTTIALNDVPVNQVFSGKIRHISGVVYTGIFWKFAQIVGGAPWAVSLGESKIEGNGSPTYAVAKPGGQAAFTDCVNIEDYKPLTATLTING